MRRTRVSETRPFAVTVIAGSAPEGVLSEYDRQCRTPSISTPIRAYWPAWCACHPRPGRKWMVAESGVYGMTAVTTPRSWRAELSGLTSHRKSSGARGVVKTEATRLKGWVRLIPSACQANPLWRSFRRIRCISRNYRDETDSEGLL